MQIVKIDNIRQPESSALTSAVEVLKQGSVVMHPTETCYGFAVDIFQQQALQMLYDVKKMALDKPVSMMVRSLEEALQYAEFNPLAYKIAEKFWPGPVTLILSRKKSLPYFFNQKHLTVGIRCPDSVLTQALIEGVGRPLSTTSANISGEPEVYDVATFLEQLDQNSGVAGGAVLKSSGVSALPAVKPGLILDAGQIEKTRPSTLVVFENDQPVFLREGPIGKEIRMFVSSLVSAG